MGGGIDNIRDMIMLLCSVSSDLVLHWPRNAFFTNTLINTDENHTILENIIKKINLKHILFSMTLIFVYFNIKQTMSMCLLCKARIFFKSMNWKVSLQMMIYSFCPEKGHIVFYTLLCSSVLKKRHFMKLCLCWVWPCCDWGDKEPNMLMVGPIYQFLVHFIKSASKSSGILQMGCFLAEVGMQNSKHFESMTC